MTPEEIQEKLIYLLDRQEIIDAIRSYTRAVDRLDEEALCRAYHGDVLDDHSAFAGNRDEFRDWAFGLHQAFHHSTQHLVANELVELDGHEAHAESYFIMSVMNRTGVPFTQVGGRYIDRLEKRGGQWKIAARNVLTDYVMPTVNNREAVQTGAAAPNLAYRDARAMKLVSSRPESHRDRDDLRYARPLMVDQARIDACRRFGAGDPTARE